MVRFNFTVFLYYVPVFAKEDLGWGQSSVSYSFLAVGGITFLYLVPPSAYHRLVIADVFGPYQPCSLYQSYKYLSVLSLSLARSLARSHVLI